MERTQTVPLPTSVTAQHVPTAPASDPPAPRSSEWRVGRAGQIVAVGSAVLIVCLMAGHILMTYFILYDPLTVALAALLAFIPVVVCTSIVLLIDRVDPEPPWALALAFLWGASISIFGARVVNGTVGLVASSVAGEGAAELLGTILSAPIAEEALKGLGLLIVLLALRKEFDGVVDGIVYACIIGLGFSMVEDMSYYCRAVTDSGVEDGIRCFVHRGILSPFGHSLFTAMTGIGCGIARARRRGPLVWMAPMLGYVGAVLLHATWNGVAVAAEFFEYADAWYAGYVLGWVPAFLCFFVAVGFCLSHERTILRDQLREELRLGVLSAEEYSILVSPRRRFLFTLRNLSRGGLGGYRDARAFSRTATRLAFSRWHTLEASRQQAETRSLAMVPLLRQQLAHARAALGR
jgi:RsiW-degrading membrane proteinase PrsW (M82 family)